VIGVGSKSREIDANRVGARSKILEYARARARARHTLHGRLACINLHKLIPMQTKRFDVELGYHGKPPRLTSRLKRAATCAQAAACAGDTDRKLLRRRHNNRVVSLAIARVRPARRKKRRGNGTRLKGRAIIRAWLPARGSREMKRKQSMNNSAVRAELISSGAYRGCRLPPREYNEKIKLFQRPRA